MAVSFTVNMSGWANIMYGNVQWDLFYIPLGGSPGNWIQGGPVGYVSPGGIPLDALGQINGVQPGGQLVVQLYDVVTGTGSALFTSPAFPTGEPIPGDEWNFDLPTLALTLITVGPPPPVNFSVGKPSPATPISVNQNGTVNVTVTNTSSMNRIINVTLTVYAGSLVVGQYLYYTTKYNLSIAAGATITVPFTFVDNGIVPANGTAWRSTDVLINDMTDYGNVALEQVNPEAYIVYSAQVTPPPPTVSGQITPGSVTFNYGSQNSVAVPDGSPIVPGQTMQVNVGFKNTGSDTEVIGVSVAIQQPDGTFIHLGTPNPGSFAAGHAGTWPGTGSAQQATTPALTQQGTYTIAVVLWKDSANGTVLDQWTSSPAFSVEATLAAGFTYLAKGTVTINPPTNWLLIGGIVVGVSGAIAVTTLIADRNKK